MGKKKIAVGLMLFVVGWVVATSVVRAEGKSLPMNLYRSYWYKQKVVEYLGEEGKNMSEEEQIEAIDEMLKQELEWEKGSVELEDGVYVLKTGLNGKVNGKVEMGRYGVEFGETEGVVITNAREEWVVGNEPVSVMQVGLREVEEVKELIWWRKWLRRVKGLWNKEGEQVERMVVQRGVEMKEGPLRSFRLEIFNDKNGNGRKDRGEKLVPWTGFEVRLRRVGGLREELMGRESELVFEGLAGNALRVEQLLRQLDYAGCGECYLDWKSAEGLERVSAMIDGEFYGLDGLLKEGVSYQLQMSEPVTMVWVE